LLVHLSVDDLGLIEHAELEMGPGLQVLTGETGVGKSMLLASMAILRGERTRSDMVRTGCDKATVRGIFHLPESNSIRISEQLGTPIEDGELVIEREIHREGRSRCRIDGRETTTTLLKRIAPLLIEVIGQGHALTLLQPGAQLDFLDRFGGLLELRTGHASNWREARELEGRIHSLEQGVRERSDRRLFLEHIVEELESAELVEGQRISLESELELMEERDAVLESIESVRQRFLEQENSILDQLGSTVRDLSGLGALHPGIANLVEASSTASILIEDALRSLSDVESDLDLDPEVLEQKRKRFDQLVILEQRYHREEPALIEYLEQCRGELSALGGAEQELPELKEGLQRCISSLLEGARKLHDARLEVVQELAVITAGELKDLDLAKARLEGSLQSLDVADGWNGMDERGADRFELLFSANPGEPLRSIADVASGGELSRLMLALQRTLAGASGTSTLIFDEIDSGVGGRLGAVIGEKLKQIGVDHQVLCVTHLPQVACHGTRHHRVIKETDGKITRTRVEEVTGEQRVKELALMLRGDRATERSLEEAREMLLEANNSEGELAL
jgi:DNA repair protein RecN (Recombination protein N)